MGKTGSCLKLKLPFTCLTVFLLATVIFETPALTFTASVGRPYQGRLINGVPFPNQFPGYYLRDQERAYATPEAIATVLDAIDAVRERYPDTCDLFIGDFSREGAVGSTCTALIRTAAMWIWECMPKATGLLTPLCP